MQSTPRIAHQNMLSVGTTGNSQRRRLPFPETACECHVGVGRTLCYPVLSRSPSQVPHGGGVLPMIRNVWPRALRRHQRCCQPQCVATERYAKQPAPGWPRRPARSPATAAVPGSAVSGEAVVQGSEAKPRASSPKGTTGTARTHCGRLRPRPWSRRELRLHNLLLIKQECLLDMQEGAGSNPASPTILTVPSPAQYGRGLLFGGWQTTWLTSIAGCQAEPRGSADCPSSARSEIHSALQIRHR